MDQAINNYTDAEKALFDKYDLDPESHYIDLVKPAIRTRVLEIGEGDPILMVHGGGGVSIQWVPLIPYLQNRRLIVVDRPGHGLSDPFNYRGVDFLTHMVDYLDGVLDHFDLTGVDVVANSMGGHWSLRLASKRPERVGSLALLGCPAMLLNTTAPFVMRLLGVRGLNSLMWSTQKPSVKIMKNLHKMMGHKLDVLEQHPREYWEAVYLSGLLPGYKDAWLSILEQFVGPFGGRKGMALDSGYLGGIQQPTVFIWGEDDAFGGAEIGQKAVDAMPNASLTTMPGGHLPWLDDPESVGAQVQSWLSKSRADS